MKRILFVVPFLSGGGAERVVSIWTSELAKLGCDVHLLVYYRVDNEYLVDEKVKIHTIAQKGKSEYERMNIWQKIKALRKALKKIQPDIVLPFITHVGLMVSVAKIGLSLKVIETIRINPRYSPQKRVFRWLRNISVLFSARCIVQTETQLLYFPKWLQKKMVIFPNPIANEFIQNEKVFTEKRIRRIVAVGRLEKQKNFPMLIKAFYEVLQYEKDLQLNIYGEGSLYSELNEIIISLNLQGKVLLSGRTDNMASILPQFDLFVLSSDAEGMPNSLMEAMAIGLPCISTNCPTGPADLIEDGVNGLLISVGDKEALVSAIIRLVSNVDEAILFGKKARKDIIDRFSAKKSAIILKQFIDSI